MANGIRGLELPTRGLMTKRQAGAMPYGVPDLRLLRENAAGVKWVKQMLGCSSSTMPMHSATT